MGLLDGQHRQSLCGELGGGDLDFGSGAGFYMQTQTCQAQLSSGRVHTKVSINFIKRAIIPQSCDELCQGLRNIRPSERVLSEQGYA
jgi:hypothetical protein